VVLSELGGNNVRKAVKLLEDSLAVLKKRKKVIRIADKSEGGWKTVDEYLSDEVASDSEGEKRIRVAENRAVKKIKTSKKEDTQRDKNDQRKQPERLHKLHIMAEVPFHLVATRYSPFVQQKDLQHHNISKSNDNCHNCGIFEHWTKECRKPVGFSRPGSSRGAHV
jgi:hypothetical protein